MLDWSEWLSWGQVLAPNESADNEDINPSIDAVSTTRQRHGPSKYYVSQKE